MNFYLFAFFTFFFEPYIQKSDIFIPLSKGSIAITQEQIFFLLDTDEAQLDLYDANGKFIKRISQRGNGPHELKQPRLIFWSKPYLYVLENGYFTLFDKEGSYTQTITNPSWMILWNKTNNGWIGHEAFGLASKTGDSIKPEHKILVEWRSPDFKEREIILNLPDPLSTVSRPRNQFNPINDHARIKVSPNGNLAAIRGPGESKIYIIDTQKKAVSFIIQHQSEKIKVDPRWVNEQKEKLESGLKRASPGIKLKAKYPEYFPPIKRIEFDFENNLAVYSWTQNPNIENVKAYDRKGNITKTVLSSLEIFERVVAIRQGIAYVITFHDEEAGIDKVPVGTLSDFINNNPIKFDHFAYMDKKFLGR